MSRDRAHTHPCAHCKSPVDCAGSLERNYDGFPEVVCEHYETNRHDHLCETCYETAEQEMAADAAGNL